MKKILCLLIAIASMCLFFVSCNEDILKETEDALVNNKYDIPEKEKTEKVDFYIISGNTSDPAANRTVQNKLNDMFKTNHNTEIQMHYISAAEYAATVKADLSAPEAKDKAFVVLVNSEELYDDLKDMGVLVNISPLLDSKSYQYGTLKKQIPSITVVKENNIPAVDKDGNPTTEQGYYIIPNNQVYHSYNYILINREMAIYYSMVSSAEACKTAADVEAFITEFKELCRTNTNLTEEQIEAEVNNLVKKDIDGYRGDMVEAEKENYVVISSSPKTTKADVCSSGFVIAGDKDLAERAMRVIYAINTDSYYRNLLQYGVEDINYSVREENGIKYAVRNGGNAAYNMTLSYTGDIYMAYNCKELCIFCTDVKTCEDHIYWTPDNNATATTWIEYNLNGGEWENGFTPVMGLTNTELYIDDDYVPVKASDIIVINGIEYNITYTFKGWYSSVALTEDSRVKEVESGKDGILVLYAKWEETRTPIN